MLVANLRHRSVFTGKARLEMLSFIVDGGLPALVVLCGIAGQYFDSIEPRESSFFELHALFGTLLCLAVMARFLADGHDDCRLSAYDIDTNCRRRKRLVYVLLYGLAGIKLMMNVVVCLRHGDDAVLRSFDDFQPYVICGVLAIMLVRALAGVRLFLAQRPSRDVPGVALDSVKIPG